MSDHMHIAFFLPALNSGGAEKNTVLLAEEMARLGHRVDILLVKRGGAFLKHVPANVRLIELNGKGMLRSLLPLKHYLAIDTPDALIAGLPGPNSVAVMAKLLLGKTLRTKIIITQHIMFSCNVAAFRGVRSRVRHWVARRLFPHADAVIAVSQGVAADLLLEIPPLEPRKIKVIYNPVNIARAHTLAQEDISHPWLEDKITPVLIAVGRLMPQKDYPNLIAALTHVRDVRILICGEGTEQAKNALIKDIEDKGLKDRVDLLGFVDNPFALLARADMLVLPSRFEGFGNVLIEAMAVGTPVVSTDCPSGPAEVLNNGAFGALVPVGEPEALAAAIKKSLDTPIASPEQLKSRAKDFDIKTVAQNYLNLCR